ncbi:FAD-binding domain-containing protein [Loktanella sp. S4079]|uniref:FAD-binding domain-containing protein n=1 Tax=Loktanella sp. S4079 TaxID=579483 RepID=UPI0005F9E5FC|nr:deoxyribodipyrimidine photo-lyase [Loktanella sp. S4079]KJZ17116.1 deoxyribodipyrimidine photolyase [Loktanella sp. S4079]
MQIVWFKRDLRVTDHRALAMAAEVGPVLPLYIVEPELWRQPDASYRQWAFVAETLSELRVDLARIGQPLVIRSGTAIDVLTELKKRLGSIALWSHEETGNGWTYQRDLMVAAWCRDQGVPWREVQNHGVWRRLKSRNGWSAQWDALMKRSVSSVPRLAPIDLDVGGVPSASDLGFEDDRCTERQVGGRRAGIERLDSFLNQRGEFYQSAMSSPVEGATACSRLSPYLAWGALSIREVTQATQARRRALPPMAKEWRKSLRSFSGRLHWHCHFIQKLEDEPSIEVENLHRLYDGLRPQTPDATLLAAWTRGETGYPFLDACMRSLRACGWLNFRMRAMVMAAASYHLWLDWRAPGLHLARMFTDYEPGIHWSQVQMQSGTTGINAVRIYNPVKQGYDQDPKGVFIRKWLPELAMLPDTYIHEPWKADNAAKVIGGRYPVRVFDHLLAAKAAREKVWSVRKGRPFREQAQAIVTKHASRKSTRRTLKKTAKAPDTRQLNLPFGDQS